MFLFKEMQNVKFHWTSSFLYILPPAPIKHVNVLTFATPTSQILFEIDKTSELKCDLTKGQDCLEFEVHFDWYCKIICMLRIGSLFAGFNFHCHCVQMYIFILKVHFIMPMSGFIHAVFFNLVKHALIEILNHINFGSGESLCKLHIYFFFLND